MPKKQSKKTKKARIENVSVALTHLIGTPASLLIHSFFFVACFVLILMGYEPDRIMLILTTIVSLEAIYLSILIQMTVNRNIESLKEVEEDIDEIQEDVEELTEDVAELGEGIEEDSEKEEQTDKLTLESIGKIEASLQKIVSEIENIKAENNDRSSKK